MIGNQSRRAFLQRAAALGVAGSATSFVTQLAGIGEAAAATANDYKALVCVFLYGGNDYANTLPPYDQASYDLYAAARPALAHARTALAPTLLNPSIALAGGRQYALAPTMSPLLPIFDAGRMAVMLNVGTLVRPTTKAQYTARSVALPPKLFSQPGRRDLRLGRPAGRPVPERQRIGDTHLHQCLGQCGVPHRAHRYPICRGQQRAGGAEREYVPLRLWYGLRRAQIDHGRRAHACAGE